MKTLYCDLIKDRETKSVCGAKVTLLDQRWSTTFPHAHPKEYREGRQIAKHCPKCGFTTGYAHISVMEDPEPDWNEIKRKHDVLYEILKQKLKAQKEPTQLSLDL